MSGKSESDRQRAGEQEINRNHQGERFCAGVRPEKHNGANEAERHGPKHMDEELGPETGEIKGKEKHGQGAENGLDSEEAHIEHRRRACLPDCDEPENGDDPAQGSDP